MGIRDAFNAMEREREEAQKRRQENAEKNSDLPEGVKRYIRNAEIGQGKPVVILDDPDEWFFYYAHIDTDFVPPRTFIKHVQPHTCLHSPKDVPSPDAYADEFSRYRKPGKDVCPSCLAGIKRTLFFPIRLYDLDVKTWRVFDAKKYHAMNIIAAIDTMEKQGRKFNPNYTVIGEDVVIIKKTQDGKSFTLETSDYVLTDEDRAKIAEIKKEKPNYAELVNMRNAEEVFKIAMEADDGHADKEALRASKFAGHTGSAENADAPAEPKAGGGAPSIGADDLPF